MGTGPDGGQNPEPSSGIDLGRKKMTEKPTRLRGRIHLVKDTDGKLIDNIDTDMIYHNAHLAVTDKNEMGQYTFGNLDGYRDFPKRTRPGDLVLVGENFGSGSSRQQAVDCFASLGVTCVLALSFGAIYKRNAINSGFPIVTVREIDTALISDLEEVELELESGRLTKVSSGEPIGDIEPFSSVQLDIYRAGGLFEYARSR